jgi:hypothetical protein
VSGTARRERRCSHLAATDPQPGRMVSPIPSTAASLTSVEEARSRWGTRPSNLCRAFSPRSSRSAVVCPSRSFAVSLSRPVLPCLVCSRMVS